MKRRIARIGPVTLMISLPAKWVKDNNLKKGDDLNIDMRGNELRINSENTLNEGKVTVDISELDERVLRWLIASVHKAGYDEIELLYKNKAAINITQELVKDLMMGFIIADHTERKIVLKNISTEIEKEFDMILRKSFLTIMSLGENMYSMVKENKDNNIQDLLGLEKTNNQFTNFCQRIINKHGYKEFRKNSFIYTIIWNLEKIGDEYKYMCNFMAKNQTKMNKQTAEYLLKTNNYFKEFYTIFYTFDLKHMNKINQQKNELLEEYLSLLKKATWQEAAVLNHLKEIITKTSDFSASLIGLKLL